MSAPTLRDRLLPRLAAIRGRVGDLGMHQVQVLLRTRTWSSGKIETGTSTLADLVLGAPSRVTPGLTRNPHVKGTPADPLIVVGPVTPYDSITNPTPPAGYTLAQLNPADAPGVEYYFVVTWPGGIAKRYQLAPRGFNAARPMRVMLTLEAIDLDFAF
jgi:hypothetical protein